MRRIWAAIAALFLAVPGVLANPGEQWPEEALSVSLSKPQWILVVPVRRNADGSMAAWQKGDDWTREWIVPRPTPGGTRTVAITGDSEDARTVRSASLETMDARVLGWLAAKYKAPAVAVAVEDAYGTTAVAGWIQGEGAAWRRADGGAPRQASLSSMDDIFSGRRSNETFDVAITGQRLEEGRVLYRIEVTQDIMGDVLRGVDGLDVIGSEDADPHALIVSPRDGEDIESVLRQAGISVTSSSR